MKTRELKSKCTDITWHGRSDCRVCGIRKKVLFADIPDSEFNSLLAPIDNYTYPEKTPLYELGQQGEYIYTLRRGLIKLYQFMPNGEHRVVRLLKPGDTAGLELLVNHAYHHSAMTTHQSDICRIPVKTIEQLEKKYSHLFQKLMDMWQVNVDEADLFITHFSTGTSQSRMARLLVEMNKNENRSWGPGLNREDMGDILGISTETASRIIAEFKRRELIKEKKGELIFTDMAALEAIAREK